MNKLFIGKSNRAMFVRVNLMLAAVIVLSMWFLLPSTKTSANAPQTTFVVTTIEDENDVCDASCSLREAITAANDSPGADAINFNIAAGSAPFTISPTSALPNISEQVTIDGSTQPGFAGVPLIEINGENVSGFNAGLISFASGTVIKSLIINRFRGAGVEIRFTTGNTVTNCYIGTNASGMAALPNGSGIEINSAGNNVIGGATIAERNVISGNNGNGIRLFAGSFNTGNQIKGNYIGTAADGATALPNTGDGIESEAGFDGSSDPTFIGGSAAGEANTIAFNGGNGINVPSGAGVNIRANSIFSNTSLGIDLGDDGVTPNDVCDDDSGNVNLTLQNFPAISNVTSAGNSTTVSGSLNSKSNQTFSLDFFRSDASDSSGFGEGKTHLGSTTVTTNGSCAASFTATFAATLATGDAITATATDASGNTSEFSQAFIFGAAPTDLSVIKNDSADPVNVGDSFDYLITVTNDAAGATAFNAGLTDTVPAEVSVNSVTTSAGTCSNTGNNVSCAFGNLAAGASVSVKINVTAFQAATLSNTATVGASNPDPNTANNSDTETTAALGADLTIDKTDSIEPASSGTNFNYNLLVSNTGVIAANNVIVFDNLPSGMQFISASAGCTNSSGFVQCDLGSIAAGASTIVSITVKPTTVGNFSNTASVQTSTSETNVTNNSDTETTAVLGADLALTQTAAPEPASIGALLTYTFVVTNNGPAVADSVRIADNLPIEFVSSSDACAPNANNAITLNLGTIGVGQSKTATVTGIPRGGSSAINTTTVSTATGDHNTTNNTASVTSNFATNGNAASYIFSTTTTGSFISTTGGRNVFSGAPNSSGTIVSNPTFELGFEFYFMGNRYTRFAVSPDGFIQLGEANSIASPPLGRADRTDVVIAPFGSNQNLNENSRIRTIVTGIAPNRIRVVTWSNLSSDVSGAASDLNYQVQLYEASGEVRFVYGAMQMSAAAAGNSDSNQAHIGFSVDDTAGKIGSIAASQNSSSVSYNPTSATPVVNLYNAAGTIASLHSTTDGARRAISFTPAAAPNAPGNLSFSNASQTAMQINWADNSTDENGFAIYRSIDGINFNFIGQTNANQTSFAANGLDPNANYSWRVAAIGAGNTSAAAAGSQTTVAANNVSAATGGGNWSNPATWNGGIVPTRADNVSIPAGATVFIDTDARVLNLNVGGMLEFEQTIGRFLQAKNISVTAGGALQVSTLGNQFDHEICLDGNLTNNGTLDLHGDPACCNRPAAKLTFTGSRDSLLSGTGTVTDVSEIKIFKPNFDTLATATHTLEIASTNFTVRSQSAGDTFGFANIRAGILKISGTFPLGSTLLQVTAHLTGVGNTSTYFLNSNQSLWLNNPNLDWNSAADNHDFSGFVRVSQGSAGILRKAFLESLIVEGGTMSVYKTTFRNFTQSGGTVTVTGGGSLDCPAGGSAVCRPGFEIPSVGSSMTTSGGSLVFVAPRTSSSGAGCFFTNNAGQPQNYTEYDYVNRAAQQNLTGGTVQFGSAASGSAKGFSMVGNVFNLTINNQSAGHSLTNCGGVSVFNQTLINANTTLTVGGLISSAAPDGLTFRQIGASFDNNGRLAVAANLINDSAFLFAGNGTQTYSGNGIAGTNAQPINGFDIFNQDNVTISPASPTIITNRVNLFSGTFINSNKIQIGSGGASAPLVQRGNASTQTEPPGAFDAAPTFNIGSGGLQLLYANAGTNIETGFEIPASRVVRRLLIDCPNGLSLDGDNLTVTNAAPAGSVQLTNGIFSTGANTLIVGATTAVTRTNGYVNGNLQMIYAATGSKTFHTGTANGYSPVTVNVTALSTNPSSLTVKAIESMHPNAPNPAAALKRYWNLTETGDLTAILTFQYLEADLPATVESSLELKRYTGAGTSYDTIPATLDASANTATTTGGISNFSDWTLLAALAPTAAEVSIGGRATSKTRGIAGARVTLTDAGGNQRFALTNSFGFYQFANVPAGATYILSISHKRYRFEPSARVVFVSEETSDLNFAALP